MLGSYLPGDWETREVRVSEKMDNLTKHWQNMTLNAREGEELGLDDESSTKNFTMAAKFFTRRALNVEAVIRTFSPLWRSVKGFEVRRSSDHILLFTFEKKEEVERIMDNAPGASINTSLSCSGMTRKSLSRI